MTDPISIHNVPAQLNMLARPKWDRQKKNSQPGGESGGNAGNATDEESSDGQEVSSRHVSDGIVGTQVDLEA